MKAIDEVRRLRAKLDSGELDPEEPLFVLRARDCVASRTIRSWGTFVLQAIVGQQDTKSAYDKVHEASQIAHEFDAWPVKQVPGMPCTRRRHGRLEPDGIPY